ncbi:MAG: tetratricopeptide repeat protein [Acidobacteria bacterium]|nr:tetratricopeptide repeat protein [Acidobacteriota bacterium]
MVTDGGAHRLDRGLRRLQAGDLAGAEEDFQALLLRDAEDPNALNLLGLVRRRQGRAPEALALFQKASDLLPEAAGFHNNLGTALRLLNRIPEAENAFREALRLEPGNADAALNLSRLLRLRGDYLGALAFVDRALPESKGDAELWSEKGEILSACGDSAQGLDCHRVALRLAPGSAAAWAAFGASLLRAGDAAAALAPLARSLELDPGQEVTSAALLMAHQYAGVLSPAELFELHREVGRCFQVVQEPPPWELPRDPERPLRVGLLSPDLRGHSVTLFLESFVAAVDPSRIHLFAYSVSPRGSQGSPLRPFVRGWLDCPWLGPEDLARRIREDRMDVLLELAGHTEGGRLDVVARRPAPIQVFWLGYPGSTGLEAFQGRLTDAVVDPPEGEGLSSELPLRLPSGFHCFKPDPEAPAVSALPSQEKGIVTFASFNNLAKLTPGTLRTWAALLRRISGSRLLLKSNQNPDPFPLQRVQAFLAEEGVAPSRVQVMGRLDAKAEHLAQYQAVDLALDPFPYNGVTTTCEALWMGVPVVTLLGDRPAARYGASLLKQAGLEEFVARDLDEYLGIARTWAQDPARLSSLRAGMRERLRASALLDGPRLAREVEAALRGLWRGWCAGG